MVEASQKLKKIGVDVDRVVSRLGGNETIYLSICSKFLKDSSYQQFCNAFAANDLKSAEQYIHTLKGVAANLGFLSMDLLCRNILEDLKNNDVLYLQQYISDLSEEYTKIVEVLEEGNN